MIINGRRLFFISLVFLFVNCEKEPKSLQLVFPVEEKGISKESVEFKWEYDSDIEVDFRLYEYTKEGNLLIEKNVVGNQITVNDLNPSTTYYWEVQYGGETESSDFSTFNPLSILVGQYEEECYTMLCTPLEYTTNTYLDTLIFTHNDNGINLQTDALIRNFIFERLGSTDAELIYSANHQFSIINQELMLYVNLDLETVRVEILNNASGGSYGWGCNFEY